MSTADTKVQPLGIVNTLDKIAQSQGRIAQEDKQKCETFAKELLRAKTYWENNNTSALAQFFKSYV